MNSRTRVYVFASALWALAFFSCATRSEAQAENQINWESGPTTGKLGNIAQIKVPEGYLFCGKDGAKAFLELTGNPPSGKEIGALVPEPKEGGEHWFVIFEFQDIGYVKDDEKDKLDANALLDSIRQGTEESNKIRRERGWAEFHVAGWTKPPFYDSRTNNLTWAIRGFGVEEGKRSESVNYSVRILGRRGTMDVDLVLDPAQLESVRPVFEKLMDDFSFLPGHTYGEYRTGDKIAAYGLAALIAGGAGAVALKTGLLQKFWKLIVVVFIAIASTLKKIVAYIRRLIAGKAQEESVGQQQG